MKRAGRVWNTIDRWGPGLVAVITFMTVIALGWQYDRRLSYIQARSEAQIEALQKQIDKLQSAQVDRDSYDFKIRTLDAKIEAVQKDVDFEAAKSQNLRERLMKKGWIQ